MCLSLKVRRDLEFTFACLPLLREVLTGQQQHSGLSVYQLRLVRILRWIRLDIVEIHGATLKLSGPTIFMMKFNFMWSWLRLILFRGINFTILQIAVNIWILAWAGLTKDKVWRQNIANRYSSIAKHYQLIKVFSATLLNLHKIQILITPTESLLDLEGCNYNPLDYPNVKSSIKICSKLRYSFIALTKVHS